MIQLKHIYKTYHADRHTLRDVSLRIEEGEFTFVTGSSGAGKSTLFKIISGFEKCSSGEVHVLGRHLAQLDFDETALFRREIGFVFQNYRLIKEKTALENVMLPLEILGRSKDEQKELSLDWLKKLGLSEVAHEYPDYLSGGEQQRIAIARALVHQPKLVIADEPTGNLDWALSQKIIQIFRQFAHTGTTFLLATHDERLIAGPKSRIIHLDRGAIIRDDKL